MGERRRAARVQPSAAGVGRAEQKPAQKVRMLLLVLEIELCFRGHPCEERRVVRSVSKQAPMEVTAQWDRSSAVAKGVSGHLLTHAALRALLPPTLQHRPFS